MSRPRRSLGPVIAYLLTLLGLLLAGIWLWNAIRSPPVPPAIPHAPSVASTTPPASDEFTESERRQLENILRRGGTGGVQ